MSQRFSMKGISKTREAIIQEHFAESLAQCSLPSAFSLFNPLKFTSVLISDLDIFTPTSLSVLYARTITPPNHSNSTVSSIIEDSKGDACRITLNFDASLPIHSMIAILEPMIVLKDSTGTIEIAENRSICVFDSEQEFKNAGWGGRSANITLESSKESLLEKKMYREALKKYSIGVNNDPNNVETLAGLLECYVGLRDLDNALAISKRLLELSPGDAKVINIRAKCLVDSNRIQEAKSLVENSRINDIDIETIIEGKNCRRIIKCNRTRLCRLKELVLVEWPKLVSIEKIKKKLNDEGVNADRVSIRGKTAILIYDSVEKREEARLKLLALEDSEFMLANEPAVYE